MINYKLIEIKVKFLGVLGNDHVTQDQFMKYYLSWVASGDHSQLPIYCHQK